MKTPPSEANLVTVRDTSPPPGGCVDDRKHNTRLHLKRTRYISYAMVFIQLMQFSSLTNEYNGHRRDNCTTRSTVYAMTELNIPLQSYSHTLGLLKFLNGGDAIQFKVPSTDNSSTVHSVTQ